MSLISVVLSLIIVGVLLWAVDEYVPMEAKVKKLLNIVVIIIVVLWLVQSLGLIGFVDIIKVK